MKSTVCHIGSSMHSSEFSYLEFLGNSLLASGCSSSTMIDLDHITIRKYLLKVKGNGYFKFIERFFILTCHLSYFESEDKFFVCYFQFTYTLVKYLLISIILCPFWSPRISLNAYCFNWLMLKTWINYSISALVCLEYTYTSSSKFIK